MWVTSAWMVAWEKWLQSALRRDRQAALEIPASMRIRELTLAAKVAGGYAAGHCCVRQ